MLLFLLNVKIEMHTVILLDPFRASATMSKSEFMQRRKWSDGFLRLGHGNPTSAKNCKINFVSRNEQIYFQFYMLNVMKHYYL